MNIATADRQAWGNFFHKFIYFTVPPSALMH
jgi:hypothetical protein